MWVNIEYHLLCVKNFLFYEEKYIENNKMSFTLSMRTIERKNDKQARFLITTISMGNYMISSAIWNK